MKSSINIFTASIVLLWAAGVSWSFWYFEGQYMRPVERPAGAAATSPSWHSLPPMSTLNTETGSVSLAGSEPITVLNFWNPNCPCSKYAEGDVRKIIAQYAPQGVRFITVIADGSGDTSDAYTKWKARNISGTIAVADINNKIAMKFGVWAAPAAVILNRNGLVEYVGAYNAARYCSNTETAFAAQALSEVLQGKKPTRAKTLFFGCQLNSTAG